MEPGAVNAANANLGAAASAPSKGPNTGAIAGAIVAVIVVLAIGIGGGVLWFVRKKRQAGLAISNKPSKEGIVELHANGQEASQADQV